MTDNYYLERPVFICGHRKCGTTMLINLLDGAPDALVYPDDSGFFYMYYPRYASDNFTDLEKKERLANRIAEKNLGEVIERLPDDKGLINNLNGQKSEFVKRIRDWEAKSFTTKDILQHFIESFRKSFYLSLSPKVWIEKTTSSELYALELADMFPKAKFVHIIRDPRDNWASLKSGWDSRYKYYNDVPLRLMQSVLERGKLGMEFAKHNLNSLGSHRYLIVKYEDLVAEPEAWIRQITRHAGIDFGEHLLTTTVFGRSWKGNNFDGLREINPHKINVGRWRERISNQEAQLIEYYFKDVMAGFDYDLVFSDDQAQRAALEHYKWHNFSMFFSDE